MKLYDTESVYKLQANTNRMFLSTLCRQTLETVLGDPFGQHSMEYDTQHWAPDLAGAVL